MAVVAPTPRSIARRPTSTRLPIPTPANGEYHSRSLRDVFYAPCDSVELLLSQTT